MIVAGAFSESERISESDLADKLSVSRTPVREALQRLEGDGLVLAQGRGVRIRYLSDSDLVHVYQARAALEGLTAQLVAKQQSGGLLAPIEIDRLKQIARDTDYATRDNDANRAIELNRRFHRQIAVLAQNPVVLSMLDTLWDQIFVSTRRSLGTAARVAQVDAEHTALILHIEHGDSAAARQSAVDHVMHTHTATAGN